jgi:hypothetical protein
MGTSNIKDNITTIAAYIMVIAGAVNAYLQVNGGKDINWFQLAVAVILAITAYLTGKNPNGTTKVINPATGQQDINPNAVKSDEKWPLQKN